MSTRQEKHRYSSSKLNFLRNPKFLLIYTPLQFLPEDTAKPEGSLGLLYIAGALLQHGYEVKILDACVGNEKYSLQEAFYQTMELPNGLIRIGMSLEQIGNEIGPYDVIGITSIFTQQTSRVLEVTRFIKRFDRTKLVIIGGGNARHQISRFIEEGADIICLSEAESTILEIGDVLRRGATDFSHISGIAFEKDGHIIVNYMKEVEKDLDKLPIPAWDLAPLKRYWEIARPHGGGFKPENEIRYASLMTSRGCANKCQFCHISKEVEGSPCGNIRKLRMKSKERVIREIDILKGLGIQYVFLEDDSLLANKKRAISIFNEIRKTKLILSDVNGVNIVHLCRRVGGRLVADVELLENMVEAGFTELSLPFESGSQRVLNKYTLQKLNLEKTDTISIIRAAKNLGLIVGGSYLIGYPDESYDEMTKTIMLAKRHIDAGMDRANLMCIVPFPGSKLYDNAVAEGHFSPNYDPDKLNWLYPTMVNTIIHPEVLKYVNKICWKLLNKSSRIDNISSMSIVDPKIRTIC